MQRRFLFVSGCPRSGTTILTHILNWGDSTFVGQERYATLMLRQPAAFVPALFGSARLATFEKGDCGYEGFDGLRAYQAAYARPKDYKALGDNQVLGDKNTYLYRHFSVFGEPAWAGEDVTVLHIVRNAQDVAASYQTRLLNPKDRWDKTVDKAVADWTESVNRTHAYLRAPHPNVRLGIVDYDTFFSGDFPQFVKAVRRLYRFARLEFGPEQRRAMAKIFEAGEKQKKVRASHDDIRQQVAAQIPPAVLARHAKLAEKAIA